jgi:two-component system, LuxR family, sensor kinase FixL
MTAAPPDSARGRISTASLQALLDAAVDAIVTIDVQGRMVGFNRGAERMFGYNRAEVLGRLVNVLMPEPYQHEHGDYLRHYLNTGERRVIGLGREVQGRHKSGRIFPVWLSVGEAIADDTHHFVGIIHDLSEQRAAEEARVEMEARLDHVDRSSLIAEMAAGIAHEINQPLSAISTYAQAAHRMLGSSQIDNEALLEACREIHDQAHRAGKVIDNLRRFIRKQEVEREPVDINAVIADVLTLVRADVHRAGFAVEVDLAESLPPVMGNSVQLQQVLLNLTHNAVEAMRSSAPRSFDIRVTTEATESGGVRLEVTDHGPGVPESLGDGIFHPFVTTKPEGLGVGLAISRTIVQNHGGSLTYHNNAGSGATFAVELPAALEEGE